MFRTGFNEFIAPWKMIEMSFHRTRWIERSESFTRFLPSNRISPRTIFPLYGSSRMMERAVVVLPQPLSPARPRASPSPTSNDTPSTAWTVPACVVYSIERSSTSRRASLTPPQSGVQDFVEGVPEQVKAEHQAHDAEPGHDEPPGIVQDRGVFDRFRDDPAPAVGVAGRNPRKARTLLDRIETATVRIGFAQLMGDAFGYTWRTRMRERGA